jgi:hypothetical protein
VGGIWLALTCGTPSNQSYRLYNTATGRTRSLAVSPLLGYQGCRLGCISLAAVGSDWVGFQVPALDEHIVPSYEFQNINTGRTVTKDPTGTSTTVDLNTARLVKKLCRPLESPVVSNGYSSGWGSLTFDSVYAIAAGGAAVLERCGAKVHRRLTLSVPGYTGSYPAGCAHLACPLASNAHAVIWPSTGDRLSGLFLPSLKRFTIRIPAKVRGTPEPDARSYQLALTPRTLYVNLNGHIFGIPAPVIP